MRTKKHKLAIFDIDGTIFRSSLLIESFHALIDAGIYPASVNKAVEKKYHAWLDRRGHYDDYLLQLVRVYYRNLRGKAEAKVRPVLDRVVREQRHRTYRYTRNLIGRLRDKGYLLVALSNSQDTVVHEFARVSGFHESIGRPIEVKGGTYTGFGIINGERFPADMYLNKPRLLRDHLAARGIAADLKRSIAIGDSEGDRDILEVVGQPIAFNPSSELARLAKRRGWRMVVERKDVMYHIKDARLETAKGPQERTRVSTS